MNYSCFIVVFLIFQIGIAQVGINTINPKAMLDINASNPGSPNANDGLLIPRITVFPATNPGIDQDGMLVYLTTAVGIHPPGIYNWNNATTTWQHIKGDAGGDADFFEESTTLPPDNINDDIFTLGNVAIGKNTADYPIDIQGSGLRGVNVFMNGLDNTFKIGVRNEISNTGNGEHYGVFNTLSGVGNGAKIGVKNRFASTANGGLLGLENTLIVSGNTNNTKRGVLNLISANGNGTHTGVDNNLTSSGTGDQLGVDTDVGGIGTGNFYGSKIEINGNGAIKYGNYIDIDEMSAGTHYGLYSMALKGNSYAGYFLGNVSIGTTSGNNYILPSSRGTVNQIMQTDGSGNLSWVDAPNISISKWMLSGNSGTNPTFNYLGTSDNIDVVFRTNAIERLRINTNGNLITPNANIKFGALSGNNITTGAQNILLGSNAGQNITTGNSVIAIGLHALRQYSGAVGQIAIGSYAASSTTTGTNSVAIGSSALRSNTTGFNNIAIGNNALYSTLTQAGNIAIGTSSLYNNRGFNNIAIGLGSLYNNISGNNNTVVGKEAALRNTGTGNTIMGYFASIFTTTGNYNTIFGNEAGRNGNMGNDNVLLGAFSGRQLTGTGNVFIGKDSGRDEIAISNRLIIDNSSTNTPLIYGEFDTNLLRIHGALEVADPSLTGYRFPASDGMVDQVLKTSGNGVLSWVDVQTLPNNNWSTTGNSGTNAVSNFIGTTDNLPLVFRTNNVEKVRINTNGDILINNPATVSNSALLKNDNVYNHPTDTNLNFGTGGNYFMLSSAENNNETAGIRGDGNNLAVWSPADNGRLIRFLDEDFWGDGNGDPYDNAAERAYIDPAGQYFQVSDRNKKENIKNIPKGVALAKISALNGYQYTFKLTPTERTKGTDAINSAGLMAQELLLEIPESVSINDGNDHLVNYQAVIPYLVEAIKDLKDELKNQKQQIKELKQQINQRN